MSEARSVIATVTVVAVTPISPTFVRVHFGGPELAELGPDGPVYDQRVKLIFPAASGRLPDLSATDDWYDRWRQLPEADRGAMRTYSIRDLTGHGADRRLAVDFVLHLKPGATGPASAWASRAAIGDKVIVIGPRRGTAQGGIEFSPGAASRIVLAGDETAVPAMTRILADLPPSATGDVFLEIPHPDDILAIEAPPGFTLRWLTRGATPPGTQLVPAVLAHYGGASAAHVVHDADEVWETPTFSSSGETLTTASADAGAYAWIAGESGMVATIRRYLVKDAGLDRGQVAFMGYWRQGVAMRG